MESSKPYTKQPQSIETIYNLGVCAESQSDYTNAMDMYSKADALLESPDDDINAALSRINDVFQALSFVSNR